MVTIATPAEQRVLLQNISWQTFKTMLPEMGCERGSRLAYDSGTEYCAHACFPSMSQTAVKVITMWYKWQPTLDYFFTQINDGLDRIIFVEQNFVLTDEVSETLCVKAVLQRIKLNSRAAKRELRKLLSER